MMQGILQNCVEGATEEMINILISFSHDQVINNKICLARLILVCKEKKKEFEWMKDIFEVLVKEEEHDLLVILKEAYSKEPEM